MRWLVEQPLGKKLSSSRKVNKNTQTDITKKQQWPVQYVQGRTARDVHRL